MESFGEQIRGLREEKGEPLRRVAAFLDIDQAVLSKIERGHRKATKKVVVNLAKYYGEDEKKMLIAWLSDQVLHTINDEELAEEVLKVAEEKVVYNKFRTKKRNVIERQIKKYFKGDGRVEKAWIFGSFARGDDNQNSDIDIVIKEKPDKKFSYFDLADIQYKLENLLDRKVDIGFVDTFRPNVASNVKEDMKLIYENR